MLDQRAEDLGGLFLNSRNERQHRGWVSGEHVTLGGKVALVGAPDLDPIGDVE